MEIWSKSTKGIIVFFLFFVSFSCFAIENNSRSHSVSAKEKINQAKKIETSDSNKAINLVDEAILDVEKYQDRATLFEAYITKAKLLNKSGNLEDALLSANQALMVALQAGIKDQISQSYELVSKIYLSKEYKSKSLTFLYKGLEVNNQIKDSAKIAWFLVNIPTLEFELGRLANAMDMALKSVEIFQKKGDSLNLS